MAELTPKIPPAYDELSKPTVYQDVMSRGAEGRTPPNRPRDPYMDDLVSYGWPSIARGIVLAGGAYPAVVAAVYFLVAVVATFVPQITKSQVPMDKDMLGMLLLGSLAFAAIAGVTGIIWSGIVTVVTLPVVHAVVWSMKLRPTLVWLGAFAGGLVAFVAIMPGAMQINRFFDAGQGWAVTIMLLMGPALATVVGQVGGARGGIRANARIASSRIAPKIELLRMKFAMSQSPAEQTAADSTRADNDQDAPRFQFRTIHLLWVGVWVSLLLTIIRLSGIPYELILPMLFGWTAFQSLSLLAGKLLVSRFGPWWNSE
jgi:hypothetical protein